MKELKSIDVMSAAKMGGMLGLACGAIKGVLVWFATGMLTGMPGMNMMMTQIGYSSGSGLGMVIGMIVGGAIAGFISGAVIAWLYSFCADRWGGVELGL